MDNQKIQIAFQGVAGAYSDQAARHYLGFFGQVETIPTENFRKLFEAIEGEIGVGMVPIENSTAGSVVENFDLLYTHDVEVIGEFVLPIRHALLGLPSSSIDTLTTVTSHPQALSQCADFIHANNWKEVAAYDTAGSADIVANNGDRTVAAIASTLAADLYGLKVFSENIQTNDNNKTRFLLVKKSSSQFDWEDQLDQPNKTSLIFSTKDIPAALYKCLGGFATNGVNLTKLESRPEPGTEFGYVFTLDCACDQADVHFQRSLDELSFFTKHIKILGSYPAAR